MSFASNFPQFSIFCNKFGLLVTFLKFLVYILCSTLNKETDTSIYIFFYFFFAKHPLPPYLHSMLVPRSLPN